MRKNSRIAGLSLATSLLAMVAATAPANAQNPPVLQLSDGLGSTVTIDSTGNTVFSATCVCSTITPAVAVLGSIAWSGNVGAFTVYGVDGRTKGALTPPQLDLGVGAITTGAAGGTLTISWTDVGFTPGASPATLNETTTIQAGTGSVIYSSYVGNSNLPFETDTLVATTGPTTGAAVIKGPGPTMNPFSMTNVEAITLSANALFINDFSLSASASVPLTQTCPVASGQMGVSYTSGMVTNGGLAPYTFTLTGGALPAGLGLNSSTGAITGTPSTAASYSFTVTVVDSASPANSVSTSCGIVIASPPPTLSCSGLAGGEVGSLYGFSLVAMGGLQPYTFSIFSGSLPAGLSLNASTGSINGTPTASGTFAFTAQVTDSGIPKPNTVQAPSCSIVIAPPPSMTCSAVNTGTIGTPWPSNSGPTVTGGTPPYTFSYKVPVGSSFPTGLSLNTSTGVITGTPTAAGTFAIYVMDKNGVQASSYCTINVPNTITVTPLSLTCPLGTATVGAVYSSTPVATGGVPPYTYSVSAGSLPAGLTLNSSTGLITGTPTGAGTSGFTIKVTDSKGTVATSTCTGTCATATALINFNSPTGNLGTSHAYTVSGTTITAYGYTNSGGTTGLDGQNNYGVQNDGLGISSASGGQIDTNNFVQLDFTKALAAGATNGQISISGINQCQNGESYDIYGSNTPGSIGTLIVSAGSKDSTLFAIPSFGTYKYISVRAHSGSVLIAEVSFSLPGTTCSITVAPAPAPKISIKKTANVSKVNPFQPVIYTYVVTNTGSFTLTNVVVMDDNATPSYTGDDFQVGTVASLAAGASVTFTKSVIPPVSEGGTQQSWNGWGNNYSGWGGGWGSNNTTTAGTLICSQLSNGNYQIVYRQDPSQTDNTYGRGSSSSWAGQQRNFTDMLSGQAAEFKFLDKNGNTVLDVATDYISKSSKFPSGYGTLGISGGNGAVISGSGSHVVSCDTTLSHNINQSSSFYQCTQNSPSSSSWDNVSGYTIVVDSKTFGSAGWGGVAIPDCHNENSIQQSCNDQKVSPVSSSSTNTATVTASDGSITVSATATATVQIDASQSGWSQCSKY